MSLFLEVKITDGLGNQLFQYATGRSLAIKKGIKHFLLNIDSFKYNSLGREFGLRNFHTGGKVITSGLVEKILRKDTKYNRLASHFPFYKTIMEDGLKLQELSQTSGLFLSLSGYWQSEHYFKDIRPLLLRELVPVDLPPFPDWIHAENTVAVHVRRTDYLSTTRIGALGESYYRAAMSFLRSKIKKQLFIFFSDDIGWCRESFEAGDTLFCEAGDWDKDYHQLYLMSRCAHQVIANSSFSWWGAWLNNKEAKIVVRPAVPFTDSTYRYESYYPAEWIGVEN
jgi:hypothetical protein